MKYIYGFILTLFMYAGPLSAAEEKPVKDPTTWAVIVSGINKDPEQMQMKAKAVLGLEKLLVEKAAVPKTHIGTLLSRDSTAYQPETLESTSENIIKVLELLKDEVTPEDTFIFYYTGQANLVKDQLRLNLPGPDLCDKELAEAINAIKPKRSLIILDCPGSGHAVQYLTAQNRVLIMSAHVNQPWSTRLSSYLVPAMTDKHSDYNQDKKISVLEAFRYAAMQMDNYYLQQDLMKTENPLLEDDGDSVASQQPWTFEQEKKDGKFASEWILCEVDG